jgi:hypothetical protein
VTLGGFDGDQWRLRVLAGLPALGAACDHEEPVSPGEAAFLAIVAALFRSLLQYRATALGRLFTQVFFGLVCHDLAAFYAAPSAPAPMALP